MFSKVDVSSALDSAFDRAIRNLSNHDFGSQEYMKALDVATRIHKLKQEEEKSSGVSKELMLSVGANLLGILMIIKHEHVNVITSKALSFVPRLRV